MKTPKHYYWKAFLIFFLAIVLLSWLDVQAYPVQEPQPPVVVLTQEEHQNLIQNIGAMAYRSVWEICKEKGEAIFNLGEEGMGLLTCSTEMLEGKSKQGSDKL